MERTRCLIQCFSEWAGCSPSHPPPTNKQCLSENMISTDGPWKLLEAVGQDFISELPEAGEAKVLLSHWACCTSWLYSVFAKETGIEFCLFLTWIFVSKPVDQPVTGGTDVRTILLFGHSVQFYSWEAQRTVDKGLAFCCTFGCWSNSSVLYFTSSYSKCVVGAMICYGEYTDSVVQHVLWQF